MGLTGLYFFTILPILFTNLYSFTKNGLIVE